MPSAPQFRRPCCNERLEVGDQKLDEAVSKIDECHMAVTYAIKR